MRSNMPNIYEALCAWGHTFWTKSLDSIQYCPECDKERVMNAITDKTVAILAEIKAND